MGWGLTDAAQNLLSQVQSIFGAGNVTVTSGARSASHNAGIAGASKTSQHLTGDAFDFKVTGYNPDQVQAIISQSGLSFGQSIAEYGAGMNPRNHLSVGTKGQTLVAKDGRYSARTISESAKSFADKALADVSGNSRDWLKGVFGATVGDGLADAGQATGKALSLPGDTIDKGIATVTGSEVFNGYMSRAAILIFALVFIAAGVFALSGSKNPVLKIASRLK